MKLPTVASRDKWVAARERLLATEKEFTRARDRLNAERRRLPMVLVDKEYAFDGPEGKTTLLDLFSGRRQLLVYHFMFDPAWDTGREGCSLLVDNIGHPAHLHARDTSLVVVSRGTTAQAPVVPEADGLDRALVLLARQRLQLRLPRHARRFHRTSRVQLPLPGRTPPDRRRGHRRSTRPQRVFRDGTDIFHTYSTYDRGTDLLNTTFNYLDLTALGRQEPWEEPPGRSWLPASGWWWRRHDEYEQEINVVASLTAALIVWRRVPETRPAGSMRTRRALLPVVLRDRLMIVIASASGQLLLAGAGATLGRMLTGTRGRLITAVVSGILITTLAARTVLPD